MIMDRPGEISAVDRLEANAIIDRLVADGEVFSAADARRLIALVPVTPKPHGLTIRWRFGSKGGTSSGHAAGIGDVEMPERVSARSININVPSEHRVGGYVVTHQPGTIEISRMWADTVEDESGHRCALHYNRKTGEPECMSLAQQREIWLIVTSIKVLDFVEWKFPEMTP